MSEPVTIFVTERLHVRRVDADSHTDAMFFLELLNQRSFIDNIADRGVRTLEDARRHMIEGPCASYARHGFGLFAVELRDDGTLIGLCGLLQRDYFEHPDIGYALLDRYASKGYAREVAAATLAWGWNSLKLERIVASTALENRESIRLLEKLGFRFERVLRIPGYADDSRYFAIDAPQPE